MSLCLDRLTVLLAEDTPPMRKLVMSVLRALEIKEVFTANDGEEAFPLFCQHRPDIVITDWHMNPEDGIKLTESIRRHPQSPNRTVPIIMMTGYSAAKRVNIARDAGVTEFLVKPFSSDDLSKRLAHVINHPRAFVNSKSFFGPDRRRTSDPNYEGPLRRKTDQNKQD